MPNAEWVWRKFLAGINQNERATAHASTASSHEIGQLAQQMGLMGLLSLQLSVWVSGNGKWSAAWV
jgi:hypothetical protein